jgi:D-glycero-D-manno-heptose 1,7-bisphosphate phosphatase
MTQTNHKRAAAFIDRDGTLVEEVNYLSRVEDLRLFPFTAEALRLLKQAGFLIVVVTNQSGIGRSIYGESDMRSIHDAMQQLLEGAIDAFYFCPHLPDTGCRCRKPGLGMIEDAVADLNIDLDGSWMIGDKNIDVETGRNAGIPSAMVLTGYGEEHLRSLDPLPDIVATDLLEAVQRIVQARMVGSLTVNSAPVSDPSL